MRFVGGKGELPRHWLWSFPLLERLQTYQAGMHCFPTTESTTKLTYHRSHFKLNMQQKAFGGRALPGPVRSPDAHPDVIRAVDVAASRAAMEGNTKTA